VSDPEGGAALAGSPPELEAADFGWTYAGSSRPAVGGLSFRVEPGRLLLVLGPSGSGKSTLARALAGLVPHVLPGDWRGRLRVGAAEVVDTPSRLLGRNVGLVFQDPDSQMVMSRAEDEVAFGLENRGWSRPSMRARVPEALAQVGLAGFERRATLTLSGGEKQRLAVAGVLAPAPGLLVLDEPTANLDPPGMHAVMGLLAELATGRRHTIVLIEHRLEAALPLADDVLLLDDKGRQLAACPAGRVPRAAIRHLAESGAWVPGPWQAGGRGRPRRRRPVSGRQAAETAVAARWQAAEAGGRPLLEVEALTVRFPADESGAHTALENVTLGLRSGERLALVGPNGAGKSSLLLAVAGLLRPSSGSVRLRGPARDGAEPEPARDPARLNARQLAERVGLAFQDPELGFVARTVREEVEAAAVAAGRMRAGGDPDPTAADAVLTHFGLGGHASDDPFRLSQGEQRRLSLAALALRPPGLLLLDEPTFGLDRRGTQAVLELLDGMRAAGQAQVLATHDPRLLPACERVVALDRGRIVFDGLPGAFLAAPPFSPAEPWREGTSGGEAAGGR
jgi:energy-coupling factor transporter ATP-binding protein EcfA2